MKSWFADFVKFHAAFADKSLDVGEAPGPVYALRVLDAAMRWLGECGENVEGLTRRVCSGVKGLHELKGDRYLRAQAIGYGNIAQVVQGNAYLAEIVSEWFERHEGRAGLVRFFEGALRFCFESGSEVRDWPNSISRLAQIAEREGLDFSTSELVVVLVVCAAVIVCLYAYFFFRRRPERDASEEFREVARHFHDKQWAKPLLDQSIQDWSVPKVWGGTELGKERKRRAIESLGTLSWGRVVQPSRGDIYDQDTMKSEQASGFYVWQCEMPGLRWRRRLIELPIVVRAEAEFLALQQSESDGRKLYHRVFERQYGRKPKSTDKLDPALLKDVFHEIGMNSKQYDAWLCSLIVACPDDTLVAACAGPDEEYVEQKMANVNDLRSKADATVEEILHRGLVRKVKPADGTTDNEELLFHARVKAVDRDSGDAYDRM